MDGETIATFADPTVYPATEKDSSDFSDWTTIKRPALPSQIERSMVDVIAVTDDGLAVLEPSEDRTPITELLTESDDKKTMSSEISVDDLRR